MIKDSLAAHVPGSDTTLSTHACGEEMLQLGFIRSSAIVYPSRILVAVVEPQDSARVRTNPAITTTAPLLPAWQKALDRHLGADGKFANGLMGFGIKHYPMIVAGKGDSLRANLASGAIPVPAELDSLWKFLGAHASKADRIEALRILREDSARTHQTLAIGVLANFRSSDEVWGALLHTLRDRNDVPGAWLTAQALLMKWVTDIEPRKVNWSGSADDIRALLAGTNLWALPDVMTILTKTRVDPLLAPVILGGNDVFVLGYARSAESQAANVGRGLLKQLSGRDYGANVDKWTTWAASLSKQSVHQ